MFLEIKLFLYKVVEKINIHILHSNNFLEDRAVEMLVTTYMTRRLHNSENDYPNFPQD
jgi:hypothetical protein